MADPNPSAEPRTGVDLGPVPPPLRVVVGLGDAERERRLLRALPEDDGIVIAERCLAAEQVLACAQGGRADAAIVAADLHRLGDGALASLIRARLPLVLLAAQPGEERWQSFPGPVLPLDAEPEAVRLALLAALRGDHVRPAVAVPASRPSVSDQAAGSEQRGAALTIGVLSGNGSPGRTLVAVNLAAALGAVAPTILVDADLAGPSVAAYLDADPTRNLFMLAHADPRTRRDWDRALADETQPLDPRSPQGVVLCGVPKPEMRAGVSTGFFEQLLGELETRYRFVVLDLGADLLGTDAVLHRLAVARSRQLLVVAASDLVGLWHARAALGALTGPLGIDPARLALVLNRHDRRYHQRRGEIEWALGRPVAAVIPHDHGAVQRALQRQRPVVLDRRSRAGRALLDLAERVHGDRLILPPEPTAGRRMPSIARLPRLRLGLPGRPLFSRLNRKGGRDARNTATVR